MPVQHRWLAAAASLAVLAVSAAGIGAQQPDPSRLDPRILQQLPADQVVDRLRASGLTRQEVRAELQRRGFDPSIADPYFDMLERGPQPRARATFVDALAGAGLARSPREAALAAGPDTGTVRARPPADIDIEELFGLTEADRLRAGELPVFGTSFFRRSIGLDAPAFGPVDAGYRLGPGDEVNVILTGAVQDVYTLVVTRDGTLVVPDLGEVTVHGLTVRGLEDLLRARLQSAYASGLTRISVSLGRIRAIDVFVVGDVERPGPYQLNGLATALSALHRAGGPSATGSFREIEIRRGNQVVHRLDLYDYLLHGNSDGDPRLQHGDIIFVPPVTRRVRLDGALRRPALYEMKEGEGLRDALRFAGGPEAGAALDRVMIDRILPPLERRPGLERVVLDVDAVRLLAGAEPDLALQDGDAVRVLAVSRERRNRITIVGEVRRPGDYSWTAGLTLRAAIERAAGLTEEAYTGRAHVFRLDPGTGERRLVSAPAGDADAGTVLLEERDSIVVYNRNRLRVDPWVTVGGLVQRPGRYLLHEGATVDDVILAAGGFADGAWQIEAYVARPNLASPDPERLARSFRVPLGTARTAPDSHGVGLATAAGAFRLQHGDRVEIRQVPGYAPPRVVHVDGEVTLPGSYVLETRADRVSSLIRAAGGLTAEAHGAGIHVIRQGRTLAVDAARALDAPDTRIDIVLQDGDTLRIPRFDPTILVTGAVVHDSTRVLYRPGMSLRDVIREAGGYSRDADIGRVTVTHQSGVRSVVRAVPLLPDRSPAPAPGSIVYVPERPAGIRIGPDWLAVAGQLIGAVSAAATLLIALGR
jgi:protein involved in polysaccharide export with SLBB domain